MCMRMRMKCMRMSGLGSWGRRRIRYCDGCEADDHPDNYGRCVQARQPFHNVLHSRSSMYVCTYLSIYIYRYMRTHIWIRPTVHIYICK